MHLHMRIVCIKLVGYNNPTLMAAKITGIRLLDKQLASVTMAVVNTVYLRMCI